VRKYRTRQALRIRQIRTFHVCEATSRTREEELKVLHQNGNLNDHTKACSVIDLRPSAKAKNCGDGERISQHLTDPNMARAKFI